MATTLSPAMERAMRKLTTMWQSAYTLQVGLNTLSALVARGLVTSKAGAGYMAFPSVGIKWRLTERGEQWLAS